MDSNYVDFYMLQVGSKRWSYTKEVAIFNHFAKKNYSVNHYEDISMKTQMNWKKSFVYLLFLLSFHIAPEKTQIFFMVTFLHLFSFRKISWKLGNYLEFFERFRLDKCNVIWIDPRIIRLQAYRAINLKWLFRRVDVVFDNDECKKTSFSFLTLLVFDPTLLPRTASNNKNFIFLSSTKQNTNRTKTNTHRI
jgi:hypothetical protein